MEEETVRVCVSITREELEAAQKLTFEPKPATAIAQIFRKGLHVLSKGGDEIV